MNWYNASADELREAHVVAGRWGGAQGDRDGFALRCFYSSCVVQTEVHRQRIVEDINLVLESINRSLDLFGDYIGTGLCMPNEWWLEHGRRLEGLRLLVRTAPLGVQWVKDWTPPDDPADKV